MRYPPTRKAETREKLVVAAMDILGRGTIDRLTIGDVTAAIGATNGAFYAHFPSRDALVETALERMFSDAIEKFSRPSASGVAASFIRSYISEAHCDRKGGGCPIALFSGQSASFSPGARIVFANGTAQTISTLQRLLDDHSPGTAEASKLLASLVGALSLARSLGGEAGKQALETARAVLMREVAEDRS